MKVVRDLQLASKTSNKCVDAITFFDKIQRHKDLRAQQILFTLTWTKMMSIDDKESVDGLTYMLAEHSVVDQD